MSLPLAEFDYELPPERIAAQPVTPRDASRLLVAVGADVEHRHTRNLPDYIGAGDVIVVNDTKVLPARLRFTRPSGGAGEVLLLEPLGTDQTRWLALARPSRKLPEGLLIAFGEDLALRFGADHGGGKREVEVEAADLEAALERYGELPLPPYLPGPIADPGRYQTVYANVAASAAAPTAGLHLTEGVLRACVERGASIERVELVVGLDTFRPIAVDDVARHTMHRERYRVASDVWARIEGAARVIAIGTTTVRALESVAHRGALEGRTDLFIRRGFEFRSVDVLLTNFHLPRSSLLVMIDAFAGPRWRDLYRIALDHEYRFLSFGDAMLLARA